MSTEPLPVVAYMRRGADADSGACHNLYFGCSDHPNFVNLTDHATATQRIADLTAESLSSRLHWIDAAAAGIARAESAEAWRDQNHAAATQRIVDLTRERNEAIDGAAVMARCHNEVEALLESAEAQRDALRQDAMRYRWLRAQRWDEAEIACVVNPKAAIKLGHDCPSLERLDAAIDAALSPVGAKNDADTDVVDLAAASNSSGSTAETLTVSHSSGGDHA